MRVNFNLYHYAENTPVKYTDPDGRASGAPDFYFMKHTNDDIGERAKKYNSDIFIDITNCAAWAFNLDKEPVTKVAFVGGRFG